VIHVDRPLSDVTNAKAVMAAQASRLWRPVPATRNSLRVVQTAASAANREPSRTVRAAALDELR
jgi:hypothetical protein